MSPSPESSGCSLQGSRGPPKAGFDFGPLPAAPGARYTSNYSGVLVIQKRGDRTTTTGKMTRS
jgi:hypothetical protein